MLLIFFPKNCPNGLRFLLRVIRLFLRRVVVFAALAHRPFSRYALNFSLLSTAHTWLKKEANFCLTRLFCCGIPWTVYLQPPAFPVCRLSQKQNFILCCSSKDIVHANYTNFFSNFVIKSNIMSPRLGLSFRKRLQRQSMLSSAASSKCCLPSEVGVE